MPRGTSRYDEARLQGRLWTPRQLPASTLLGWIDASDLSTLTFGTGNAVSQINDKSGNGLHLSQPTAGKQPTFSQTALSFSPGVNATRPGLIFTGSQELACTTAMPSTAIFSGFAAFQADTGAAGYNRIIALEASARGSDTAAGGYALLLLRNPLPGLSSYDGGDKSQFITNVAANSQPHVGASTNDGTNALMYADGYPASPVAYAPAAKAPFWAIGADANATDGMIKGVISEAFVTAGNPLAWVKKSEGYLAWKWGLVDQLSPAHPYKNRPPTIGG